MIKKIVFTYSSLETDKNKALSEFMLNCGLSCDAQDAGFLFNSIEENGPYVGGEEYQYIIEFTKD
jgi:hypothetical protein